MKNKTFIIAEAGVNHNGKLTLAKRLIEAAAEAGADAVKFQTFKAEAITTATAPKAAYQKKYTSSGESQYEMLKKIELSSDNFIELKKHCAKHQILFMSTPFDFASIDLLVSIGLETFKIPSGELTNLPYLRKLGELQKNIILSTGMADLIEIKKAMDVLISAGTPKEKITVLHCTTAYPTPYADVNLRAMETLRSELDVKAGYSDHTLGIEVPIAAVALGAEVIEKHFTLDKKMSGPDHQASLEPTELRQMVQAIRHIEVAMGKTEKKPTISELRSRAVVRKSIVANKAIKKNELFNQENISVKRPGTGMSPMEWDKIIGRPAPRDYEKDEIIVL